MRPEGSVPGVIPRALLAAGVGVAAGRELPEICPPAEMLREEAVKRGLLARARREKVVPMLWCFAERQSWPLDEDARLLSEISAITSRNLLEHLVPILDALRDNGVEAVLLKGGDLALHVYSSDLPRAMDDLDLLIRPPEVPVAEAVLRSLGYVQGRVDAAGLRLLPLSPEEAAAAAAGHYEIAPFLRLLPLPELAPKAADIARLFAGNPHLMVAGDRVYQLLEFDIHFNLSGDFEVADLWHGLRRVELAGRELRAQAFADLVWFLAARGYHEMMALDKPGLRAFLDLLALIERHGGAIDWERVLFIADKYALHPSLFYCLWHATEILGPVLPESVLDACNPGRGSLGRLHDWGDFVPKLLSTVALVPLRGGGAAHLPGPGEAGPLRDWAYKSG